MLARLKLQVRQAGQKDIEQERAFEWFLNNFHLIADQLRECRIGLAGGKRNIRELEDGPFRGFPAMYELAAVLVAQTDGRLEMEELVEAVKAYQAVILLHFSELLATPAIVRLALIDAIRRVIARMYSMQTDAGRDWAFLRNCITSLADLRAADWDQFVSDVSIVAPILGQDPAGVFPGMEYCTQADYYRTIEGLSEKSGVPEVEVARVVLSLAKRGKMPVGDNPERAKHVGYYLISDGIAGLEQELGIRQTLSRRLESELRQHPFRTYFCGISIVLCIVWFVLFRAKGGGEGYAGGILAGLLLLSIAAQWAVAIVNMAVRLIVKPRVLPRMNLSRGIPADKKSLVVIPSILTDLNEAIKVLEAVEIHYLSNRESHLYFGLLTDLRDADEAVMPGDAEIVALLGKRIRQLNSKYGGGKMGGFYLFHRPRRWNAAEGIWMGYERKRGKLMELNALLRGEGEENFSLVVGDRSLFSEITYVITLDADTRIPAGAVARMIGVMAHPLNRAFFCSRAGRVTRGYGILQPKVGTYLPEVTNSLYSTVHGIDSGLDPYSYANADVYQDLFGEGSYMGKGIYEVDVVLRALGNRFPENRVLSHDLLEGCYARCGLLSDIPVYEPYPSNYVMDMRRYHRWTRGDWQIAAWMLPRVPGAGNIREKNRLSFLSRWKIADNLRRSVLPITLLVSLAAGWSILHAPFFYTLLVLITIGLSLLTGMLERLLSSAGKKWNSRTGRKYLSEYGRGMIRTFFVLSCLPSEALCMGHAILIAGWRLTVSRKRMLEWSHSQSYLPSFSNSLLWTYTEMAGVLPIAAFALIAAFFGGASETVCAMPLAGSWLLSPVLIYLSGLPGKVSEVGRTSDNRLRAFARRTWRYFEELVNERENHLPPDHCQEHPVDRVAHYTSPTNIGLALLANLAARDFGYLSTSGLLERTKGTMDTMSRLERYKGHFFNWYDTLTLKPASPKYVSTVDSGNLAGHLLTLRQGILELSSCPVVMPSLFPGLMDTFRLLEDESADRNRLGGLKELLAKAVACPPTTLSGTRDMLDSLLGMLAELYPGAEKKNAEGQGWPELLVRQCRDFREDLVTIAPWLALAAAEAPAGHLLPDQHLPLDLHERRTNDLLEILRVKDADSYPDDNICRVQTLTEILESALANIRRRKTLLLDLAERCSEFSDMQLDFLYDEQRQLLVIGFNVASGKRDQGFFDLLASEARLAYFVGIAQGRLQHDSWFALRRAFVSVRGKHVLGSWTGTMFEYLMPLLVMPGYDHSLLDVTCKDVVDIQMDEGGRQGVPWGVSESLNAILEPSDGYQYGPRGIRELSLKRSAVEEVVISPYSTFLALMVAQDKAIRNLNRLSAEGLEGRFGFFEAVDYTPSRLAAGQNKTIVRSFMAHHQGMSLLAMAYVLLDQPMQRRFVSAPELQAHLLLLQEQELKDPANCCLVETVAAKKEKPAGSTGSLRRQEIFLLSNGKYHVLLEPGGGGYHWKSQGVVNSRSGAGAGSERWGEVLRVRDLDKGSGWSLPLLPQKHDPGQCLTELSTGRVAFRWKGQGLEALTEIVLDPGENVEIRRITFSSRCNGSWVLELAGDSGEGMESGIFADPQGWRFHLILPRPAVDPRFVPGSGGTRVIYIVSGTGESPEWCKAVIQKYQCADLIEDIFRDPGSYTDQVMKQIGADPADEGRFRQLISTLAFRHASLMPAGRDQRPVLVHRIDDPARFRSTELILKAHAYCRMHGIQSDLVIRVGVDGTRGRFLHQHLTEMVTTSIGSHFLYSPGGVFLLNDDEAAKRDSAWGPSAICIDLPEGRFALTPYRSINGKQNHDLNEKIARQSVV